MFVVTSEAPSTQSENGPSLVMKEHEFLIKKLWLQSPHLIIYGIGEMGSRLPGEIAASFQKIYF